MKPSFSFSNLTLLSLLLLPFSACDQGETDLGELETETSSTSGASDSETSPTSGSSESMTSGGAESMTSGGSAPMTTGASESATETDASGSSGEGIYPAACEAAGWVDSYEAWQSAETTGSYVYVAQDTTFVGKGTFDCQYNTTITVENGAVVQRVFELIEEAEGAECEADFTEVGEELGTMDVFGAHPAITMDEVYLSCCENQLDLPAEDWMSTFTVDGAGLFAHCSTAMTGCEDGCNQGGAGEASIIQYDFQ